MPHADTPLAERVQRRDSEALVEFLQLKRGALLGFIGRRMGPALTRKLEPEDIFQEVSVRALAALPTAELEERDPFGWLCQIAEQRLIDAFRRFGAEKRDIRREVPLGAGGDSDSDGLIALLIASMTTPTQAIARDQRQQKLLEVLESLPDDAREAIRLRYLEGLPSKEIATQLGKTDGAVRVLLTRSLNRLRQLLGTDVAP